MFINTLTTNKINLQVKSRHLLFYIIHFQICFDFKLTIIREIIISREVKHPRILLVYKYYNSHLMQVVKVLGIRSPGSLFSSSKRHYV